MNHATPHDSSPYDVNGIGDLIQVLAELMTSDDLEAQRVVTELGTASGGSGHRVQVATTDPRLSGAEVVGRPDSLEPLYLRLLFADSCEVTVGTLIALFGAFKVKRRAHLGTAYTLGFSVSEDKGRARLRVAAEVPAFRRNDDVDVAARHVVSRLTLQRSPAPAS